MWFPFGVAAILHYPGYLAFESFVYICQRYIFSSQINHPKLSNDIDLEGFQLGYNGFYLRVTFSLINIFCFY
jgi:hypothetical protein